MIILVEGADCTGKTTFIKLIEKLLPRAVILRSGPTQPDTDPFVEYEHRLYEHLDAKVPVIADRWHWGETIYGPLFRNRSLLNLAGWRHVEMFLRAQGAIMVYLHQPSDILLNRLAVRGDSLVSAHHLPDIDNGYQACLRRTTLPVFSFRDPGVFEAVEVLGLARRLERTHLGEVYPTFIGSAEPKTLLLGDKRGGLPPYHHDRSCFVPRLASSGHALLRYLPEAMLTSTALANANEEDVEGLVESLGHPDIVTLGQLAHDKLDSLGIKHSAVPHPQFIRRFHNGELMRYGELIQFAAGRNEDYRATWPGYGARKE